MVADSSSDAPAPTVRPGPRSDSETARIHTYKSPNDFPPPMGASISTSPEGRLQNLSRLLERSREDPSLLLAREFAGEARKFLDRGEGTSAERSLAAARLALRLGNHSLSGLSADGLEGGRGSAPSPLDPPAPPVRRVR